MEVIYDMGALMSGRLDFPISTCEQGYFERLSEQARPKLTLFLIHYCRGFLLRYKLCLVKAHSLRIFKPRRRGFPGVDPERTWDAASNAKIFRNSYC